MYNIILKFVVYLSIITSFFLILIILGVFDQKIYYTWVSSGGVTNITEDINEIPENSKHTIKKFTEADKFPGIKNIVDPLKKSEKTVIYCIIGLLGFSFLILILQNKRPGIKNYRKNDYSGELKEEILNPALKEMGKDDFTTLTADILNAIGFQLEETDSLLSNSIQYVGLKDNKKHAISINFSDIPVTKFTISEIERDRQKFECPDAVIISNNFFENDAVDTAQNYGITLFDVNKIAEMAEKYGVDTN